MNSQENSRFMILNRFFFTAENTENAEKKIKSKKGYPDFRVTFFYNIYIKITKNKFIYRHLLTILFKTSSHGESKLGLR